MLPTLQTIQLQGRPMYRLETYRVDGRPKQDLAMNRLVDWQAFVGKISELHLSTSMRTDHLKETLGLERRLKKLTLILDCWVEENLRETCESAILSRAASLQELCFYGKLYFFSDNPAIVNHPTRMPYRLQYLSQMRQLRVLEIETCALFHSREDLGKFELYNFLRIWKN